MKFNFRKITSVLASVIMLGSTIGIAAAANYPAPFVSGANSDVSIVVGSTSPANVDYVAAVDLVTNLQAELAKTPVVSGVVGAITSCGAGDIGKCKKLEKATNLFNLGDAMNAFYPTLDNEELSTVLALGVYSNDANDEFEYEQSINLGGSTLTHFQDSDFNGDKPVIGFDLADGTFIFNYTLEFTPDAAEAGGQWVAGNDLETTEMTMLGRKYYVLSARNTTATDHTITLLDTANSATITEGEPSTVTVGDKSYAVSIDTIADDHVYLVIDGVQTDELIAGGVKKIATDTYLAVKTIRYNEKETGISKVDISIGSGKIVLENLEEVELNGEPISDIEYPITGSDEKVTGVVTSYIGVTGNNLDTITLEWRLDSVDWLTSGGELTLPGFETVKISYEGFNFPKAEKTKIEADSDKAVKLSTEITEGDVSLDFLALNASETGFNALSNGRTSVYRLITNSSSGTSIILTLNETEGSIFPVTWVSGADFESYLFQLDKIDDESGKNKTTLKNLAADGSNIILSEVGDDKDKGNVNIKLTAASDTLKSATITLTSAATLYADRLVSKEGLTMKLPVLTNTSTGDGLINISGTNNPATWDMNFTEEDKDGNIGVGKSFTVTLTPNADDGGEPSGTSVATLETEPDSDKWIGYLVSALATEVLHDNPSSGLDSMEITYHGESSYADAFIAETGVTFAGGAGITLGDVTYYDVGTNALTEAAKAKNLIVVGGSCINTVAAKLLGSETPVCGTDWTAKTNVGANQLLVKVYPNPYASTKIAMLVAGWGAADTKNAVTYVTKEKPDTTLAKEYRKVTSTTDVWTDVTTA